jgi:hypothetical protein
LHILGSGPGGLHLNLESTIKAILVSVKIHSRLIHLKIARLSKESYSCGKENFGFDRDFILEVLSTCPSSTCRFSSSYKTQQQQPQPPPPFDQQPIPSHHQNFAQPMEYGSAHGTPTRSPLMPPIDSAKINMSRPMTSQNITQQIIQQQQQHTRMNQSMESLEKQRVMQQLDKKHYETVAAIVQANQMNPGSISIMPHHTNINHTKSMDYSRLVIVDSCSGSTFESVFLFNFSIAVDRVTTALKPIQPEATPHRIESCCTIIGLRLTISSH